MSRLASVLPFVALASVARAQSPSPQSVADDLLAADRRYAAAAAKHNVTDAITSMFVDDVIMPTAPGVFAKGRADAVAKLGANPDNATAHLDWTPVRVGISADGQHGFTFGYMTLTRADSSKIPLKYLAYWIRTGNEWKVIAYKRSGRPAGDVQTTMMAPSLPARIVPVNTNAADVARHSQSLGDAEREFSALAGRIGLGPAFKATGAPDAMNMGGGQSASFVIGADAIGGSVGGGDTSPSKITWGPDERVIVASSGDLGVTFGYIIAPDAVNGGVRKSPFFTVWKRASPDAPWKYIAE